MTSNPSQERTFHPCGSRRIASDPGRPAEPERPTTSTRMPPAMMASEPVVQRPRPVATTTADQAIGKSLVIRVRKRPSPCPSQRRSALARRLSWSRLQNRRRSSRERANVITFSGELLHPSACTTATIADKEFRRNRSCSQRATGYARSRRCVASGKSRMSWETTLEVRFHSCAKRSSPCSVCSGNVP